MFNVKRIINHRKDKQQLDVYKQSISNLYICLKRFREFLSHVTYQSLQEVEDCTTLTDRIASYVDIYTDNKFARPSTMIGLRKGVSTVGQGVTEFIDAVYKNGHDDPNQLLKNMVHAYDLLMAGTRVLMHTIECERQEIIVGVDIIDKYYTSQNKPTGDIKFTVEFRQPEKILGCNKEDKHGADKRN